MGYLSKGDRITQTEQELIDIIGVLGSPLQILRVNAAGTSLEYASSGVGTVTTVSVVTANGVSGSVANATSTPAITLTLGDITPTVVNATGTGDSSFTGNVGIGTTNPSQKLDVQGSIGIAAAQRIGSGPNYGTAGANSDNTIQFYNWTDGGMTLTSGSGTYNYPMYFDQYGSTRMTIKGGNVGIGTTGPTAVLHLKAGTATANTAPFKFTSGVLNTIAEAGAVEFLTDAFYGTITTGAARKTFAFLESPSFTTPVLGVASATSLATSAATPLLLTNGQLVNIALTSQTVGATTLTIPNFASVVDTFAFVTLAQTLANKTLTTPVLTGLPTGTGVATANTVSTLVARDASGNFAAGTITASLTGNASGSAATVTGAAQTAITSLGTLTALVIDNLSIDLNTISSTSGNINITPVAGSNITLDGTVTIDAGVVAGMTSLTMSGNVIMGTNSITMTGSIAATGARVTKGWFTDIESTNMPTVGGTAILTSLTAPQFTTIELGHATANTLSASGGVLSVEGVVIPSISSTNTLTNKRVQPRILSAANYTTDTGISLNIDNLDIFIVTAQAGALLFNSPGGTLAQGEKLVIRIKDNGTARALTWNAVFRAIGTDLPSTTVLSKTLYLGFFYNSTDTKWDLVASAQEA